MTEVTCDCGHTWNYTGDLAMATCPSCQRKTDVPEGGASA